MFRDEFALVVPWIGLLKFHEEIIVVSGIGVRKSSECESYEQPLSLVCTVGNMFRKNYHSIVPF